MAESWWISLSSIHISLCLVASRLLPWLTKGLRVLQRAQEVYGAPARLACSAHVASAGCSPDGAGSPRRSDHAGKPPLTAYGEPRRSTRSRPRPLRLFGASRARAPPSVIVRRGWTPRASRGTGVSQAPQAAPSTLRSPPLPSC
ncbi:hypothetical protein NDU88_003226 [Pleurodeles waltl]|uniref:Uncharacterized protein n=1 Tax=Pleurodeles waltl TaxID=8319 RepID=A0AAV7UBY1_PLEWA|nr:hypothetical protein NDU88_003226 [Pleurodeles waltl]